MTKRIFAIGLGIWLCTSAFAVVYGTMYKTPTRKGLISTAEMAREAMADKPSVVFVSTAAMPRTTTYDVPALNADGSVCVPYSTSAPAQPRRGRGLDTGDDDEPIGGNVPVGELPIALLVLLGGAYAVKNTTRNHKVA